MSDLDGAMKRCDDRVLIAVAQIDAYGTVTVEQIVARVRVAGISDADWTRLVQASLLRRPVDLATRLRPEHKTHAKAGAPSAGGRWTPFRETCELLARVVSREPGITLKAAIDSIKHHYASRSSARAYLADFVGRGIVAGVELRRSHGTHGELQLYPVEAR